MKGIGAPAPGSRRDDGASDPRLAAALAAWAADPGTEPEVLAALAAARLLVPVVAVLTELETGHEPGHEPGHETGRRPGIALPREKSADMAAVTLHGHDGRSALPVFTSVAALALWDPAARPVPVTATRAAVAAGSEGADVLAVDVAGPVPYVVGSALLRRLAEGDRLLPAYADPAVRAVLAALVESEAGLVAARLRPAPGRDARLELQVTGPEVATRVAGLLRDAPAVRRVVRRGLDVAVVVQPPG